MGAHYALYVSLVGKGLRTPVIIKDTFHFPQSQLEQAPIQIQPLRQGRVAVLDKMIGPIGVH